MVNNIDYNNIDDLYTSSSNKSNTSSSSDISLSIDETNKLRLSLGLKPLYITNDNDKIEKLKQERLKQEKYKEEEDNDQIRKYLEKQKAKRLLNMKVEGNTIIDTLNIEKDTALNWVESMRNNKDNLNNITNYNKNKKNIDKKYESTDLKGLKILHSSDMLTEGEDIILTLKDENILIDGHENSATDALENTDLVYNEQADRNKALRSKKTRLYEDKYNNPTNDYLKEEEKEKASLILNSDGAVSEEELRQLAVKARLDAYQAANFDISNRVEYSLNAGGDSAALSTLQLQSEYCEAPIFKKKKKEKSSIRKDNEGFRLPEPLNNSVKSDHGSRNSSRKVEKDLEEDQRKWDERNKNFAIARSKADNQVDQLKEEFILEKKSATFNNETALNLNQAVRNETLNIPEDFDYLEAKSLLFKTSHNADLVPSFHDDDDSFLRGSLDRLDRLKNKELNFLPPLPLNVEGKKLETINLFNNLISVDNLNTSGFATVLPGRRDAGIAVYSKLQEFKAIKPESIPIDGINSVIISTTNDFVCNIQTISDRKNELFEEEEEEREIQVGKVKVERSAFSDDNVKKVVKIESKILLNDETEVTEDGEMEVEVIPASYAEEDETVGTGLAAALALARQKGFTDKDRHLHGRSNDKKAFKNNTSFGGKKTSNDEINLRYIDEEGDEMTPKEAFRHLSHYVHGTFPSKNRAEKDHKRKQESKRMQKMSSTDTPLNSAKKTQEAMKKSGQAFLELGSKDQANAGNFLGKKKIDSNDGDSSHKKHKPN